MSDPDEGVSADGFIETGVRRDRVPIRFEPVLSSAAERLAGVADTVSVYVYGSVATGQAIVGRSDVDLLTVGLPAEEAAVVGTALSRQFSGLCRGVEVAPAEAADLIGDRDESYGMRVFLRHYCVRLQGPDRQAGLPAFRADARAARGFNGDIGEHLQRWRTSLGRPNQPTALLGQRVARKTLLAVAGLVSVHDGTWTTDRSASARRWAELNPHLSKPLRSFVSWANDEDRATASQLEGALADEGVVDEVTRTFASRIGLWPRRWS